MSVGDIDLGDKSWRQNVLVTTLIGDDFGHFGHQHRISVTSIQKSSRTLSHQHNDVTNIIVTMSDLESQFLFVKPVTIQCLWKTGFCHHFFQILIFFFYFFINARMNYLTGSE